jgi:hypothetical protein
MWDTVVTVAIGLPGGEVSEEFEIEHRLDRFQSPFLVITIKHSDGCTLGARPSGPVDKLISLRVTSAALSSHKWLSILLLRFR